jgi:hypothetical protein
MDAAPTPYATNLPEQAGRYASLVGYARRRPALHERGLVI